ncbi:MAG: hypothetical protein HOI94_04880 [Candidatus Thioglobus sp.]|nr:hypothetical protein [Candidatus Thioglobus sp.]
MVLLTASYKLFLVLILLLNFRVVAEDKPTTTDVIDISSEIEVIDTEILDLEVSYEMGESMFDINAEATDISNELLYHEYQLGTPKDESSRWNESEQMILDAKIKLQALQEKIKLEGDWGQLRFRVIDFKGEDPGQLKLRYNYGF